MAASVGSSDHRPGRAAAIAAVAAFGLTLLLLAVSASAAFAAPDTYFEVGSFGKGQPGSGEEEFNLPRKTAVDDATGNLLVADSANNRIQVFAPGGDSAAFLTEFGSGTLSNPVGIAVDQASGDVYVSDAGNNRIVRFESDGEPVPTYTLDPGFASPEAGADPGQIGNFAAAIAVDPTSGDLLVADPGNLLVSRYESDGTFVESFDGSTSPAGVFTSLTDVAVTDTGDVIVARSNQVDQFSATGGHQLDLGEFSNSFAGGTAVGFDPNTGYTLVVAGYGGFNSGPAALHLYVFDGETEVTSVLLSPEGSSIWGVSGVAIDGGSSAGAGHVYLVASQVFGCCGLNSVRVFEAGTSPGVTLDPPSSVTSTGAHLSGTVNPNGTDTVWHFELSRDGENWFAIPYPDQSLGSGTSPVPVSADPDNLQPNTEYRVRLVAENEAARSLSAEQTFSTDEGGPTIEMLGAGPIGDDHARLNARVNPNGLATTYYFEYGGTTAYGSVAPASEAEAGSGTDQVFVSAEVEGLAPGTQYHYRLIAKNSAGTSEGADTVFETFTAAEAALPRRGLELVNQPDKGQQNPAGAFLAPERDRVLWSVFGGTPTSTSGAGATFLADRSATGWNSTNLLPAASEQAGEGYNHYDISSYTPDLANFVIVSQQGILTESDSQILTLDDQGNQKILWSFSPGLGAFSYDSSDDLAHVLGLVEQPIDPRHSPEEISHVYDFGSGTPELVDILPDGSVPSCGIPNGSNFNGFGSNAFSPYRWISATDASQVFFQTRGNDCGGPLEIYVRHRDTGTTTWISGPPVAGPDRGAWFIRGNEDADAAMFVTQTRLVAADTNTSADIYRYRRGEAVTCITCSVSNAAVEFDTQLDRRIVVSDDFSHVYFTSRNQLIPGKGKQGEANLYVWSGGSIDYVSPAIFDSLSGGSFGLTPDGNVLIFRSSAPGMTTDDNGGFEQYYRYEDSTRTLECVTCRPDGGASTAFVRVAPSYRGASAMSRDGSTYVFQTVQALLPEDVNGTDDVYEWHNGSIGLVTDGETVWPDGPGALSLQGISRDASNVIFIVGARLTGYESDQVAQLYDARIGGGFGSPPVPPAPCAEDACQGPLEASPNAVDPGSSTYVGPGNRVAKKGKKCAKGKVRRGKRCVKKKPRQHRKRAHTRTRGESK